MTTITSCTTSSTGNQVLMSTALRRKLDVELANIKAQITEFGSEDKLSKMIDLWHTNFSAALCTNADLQPILQSYIQLLQKMLVDSITQAPLDEKALLGSDKRTYGYKPLCIYLNSVPEQYRERSPLDPENEEQFTAVPHDTARFMVQWLESYEARIQSESINRDFSNLTNEQLRNIIPNAQNNRLRRIRQAVKNRSQVTQEFADQMNAARSAIKQQITRTFDPMSQRIERFSEKTMRRLGKMEEADKENLAHLQGLMEQTKKKVLRLDAEIEELDGKIKTVGTQISQAKKEDLEIRKGIKEIEKAIEEMSSGVFATIFKAVAVIGCCAVATWAVNGVLSAAGIGSSAKVTFFPGGVGGKFYI